MAKGKGKPAKPPANRGKTGGEGMAANSHSNSRAAHLQQYQFRPGQSGNIEGRPKKTLADEAAKALLASVAESGDKSKAEALMEALYRFAIKGDVTAAKLLLERAEGKPLQKVQMDANVSTLSDEDRSKRIAELLERARTRADETEPQTSAQ